GHGRMTTRDLPRTSAPTAADRPKPIAPLESGDRLTRVEFERRYEVAPHIRKAELVEGVVYVSSPERQPVHSRPKGFMVTWVGTYHAATPGVDFGTEATVRLDPDNEVQPDAFLRLERSRGGQSDICEEGYI